LRHTQSRLESPRLLSSPPCSPSTSVLAAEALPQRREGIQRELDTTDRQVDQLVCQLYGLTDEEIRIVEDATG
jgi:hypothetical protein